MDVDEERVVGGGAGLEARIPKRTGPGVAGDDRREEPPKNQTGRGDLTDAEMRLVRELDGNVY